MTVSHIRAPMPADGKTNRFYGVDDLRVRKTLCGQPVTNHDIRYGWQAFATGDFEPCPECVRIRDEAKKEKIRK